MTLEHSRVDVVRMEPRIWGQMIKKKKKKSEETGEELWQSARTFCEPAVGSKSIPTLSLSLDVCVSALLINNNSKSDLKQDTWF